ncbi:TonB-dependent siderophore receptor [Sphingomonas sp. Leaf62]|uniref:TonB-dependent siderophore receptor n=1 Tax=Sphingomonas sp. Leaf62 TaxID=1736228 RepID=UPI0009E845B6|nr:TonB-dependent receptor [Sphingomonas sp. Leaf62]
MTMLARSVSIVRNDPKSTRRTGAALLLSLLCGTALAAPAQAQETAATTTSAETEPQDGNEIVVTGSLNALPVKDVGSVFGFDKTLVETPRSASTISDEQIERFGITDIYDLVAQSPGTFTNSFFGVGGALDIRGTPGETYFRGVRRLDNAGNYPTPIAAADRIDIVRGPASPIYGPSKTGGYLNFVPKSARVAGGALLSSPRGEVSYTGGSWDRNNLRAEVRGPVRILGTDLGYSLYAEIEDSGSYYRNMSTKQTILQGSFDHQLTDRIRIEFGGQYQNFKGQQNGGWNRLTQQLVDDGTYITGTAKPLDTSGDGQISQGEINASIPGGLSIFGNFTCPNSSFSPFASGFTDACFTQTYPQLNLVNTGTTKLSRRDVLTGVNDKLTNKQTTLYYDVTYDGADNLTVKNQLFFDNTQNINNNDYGFSQRVKSYVIEDKIVVAKSIETSVGKFSAQVSPSIRYVNFDYGDDFDFEYFHRVDLIQGYTPASNRLLANECNCGYTDRVFGHTTDYGIAGLFDLDFAFGLDLLLGGRYDKVDASSRYDASVMDRVPTLNSAKGSDDGWSWTASASYKLPFGIIPYATASQQSTIVVGQGAEVLPEAVASGFMSTSRLYEGGVKGSWLNDTLYAALSVYKQNRTDFNIQSITVNQAVETKGVEAETRWAVDRHLLITAAYTHTEVVNLTGLENGSLFSFFGIDDLVNVTNPTLHLGGQPIGLVPINSRSDARRAGIPANLYSATATYGFDNGLSFSGSLVKVDSVFSGQSQAVRLPGYTLLDLSSSYQTGPWLFRGVVKNATNARYFRANFTELFGSTIVLPERPRSFLASAVYKF